MSQKQPSLLERMRQGEKLTAAQQLELVVTLSIPAIMAQITSIVMQYIDASMVGSLGADASASIGLVSSSTWLFGGITGAVASGFSIQAAHKIGAGREDEARSIMRQSLLTGILISCALLVLGVMISGPLPGVLGGEMQIRHGATVYFRIFVLFLPVLQKTKVFQFQPFRKNMESVTPRCSKMYKNPYLDGNLHLLCRPVPASA